MNKILIIVVSLIFLTACGQNNQAAKVMDESDIQGNSFLGTDDPNTAERIRDINNGLTPKVKPTGRSQAAEQSQNQAQQQSEGQQVRLEDLASKYSLAVIKTNMGDIMVEFFAKESPLAVNNFMNLAAKGFYNGTKFHRIIKGFMIQGGDPLSKDEDWSDDGRGGPGYQFQDEFNDHKLVRGSFAMANSGPNTNGSQFFIVATSSTPWLDGKHVNFGQVVDGMDIVDKIENVQVNENSHPLKDVVIMGVELK